MIQRKKSLVSSVERQKSFPAQGQKHVQPFTGIGDFPYE